MLTALTLTAVLAPLALAAAHGRDEKGRRRTFRASLRAAFEAGATA